MSPGVREGAESPQRAGRVIDVDGVCLEDAARGGDPELGLSFEGYASALRRCQGRMRSGVYKSSERPPLLPPPPSAATATRDPAGKATFV